MKVKGALFLCKNMHFFYFKKWRGTAPSPPPPISAASVVEYMYMEAGNEGIFSRIDVTLVIS